MRTWTPNLNIWRKPQTSIKYKDDNTQYEASLTCRYSYRSHLKKIILERKNNQKCLCARNSFLMLTDFCVHLTIWIDYIHYLIYQEIPLSSLHAKFVKTGWIKSVITHCTVCSKDMVKTKCHTWLQARKNPFLEKKVDKKSLCISF